MAGGRSIWPWLAVAGLVAAFLAVGHGHGDHDADARSTAPHSTAAPTTSAPTRSATPDPNDPAQFAGPVVTYARQAGVHAQLLMAILYNESYKPHDPAFERAWQKSKPDAAFGIANMHRAAFDDTKRGRPFANRSWEELPDHPDLAIQAAAWYLHDLQAQLPAHRTGAYTTDQLLALGYNTGTGNMRLFAEGTSPGSQARSYLDTLRGNWAKAAQALK
ncbi:transglycosylase SLT domain-containing protein [Streptomyces sp. NPDC087270]|uniref:transglycosylase SLT domain-containing protein n=1 Tax=Streptomyces sp. NPDC087270 TaxID=3365774 RepID=UPI00382DFA17